MSETPGETARRRWIDPIAKIHTSIVGESEPELGRRDLIVVVLLLAAATLLPRFTMAFAAEDICDDGYYYIGVARLLESGRFTKAFQGLGFNLYPVILAGGHQLGLDWIPAAQLWGVLISTCTVFPLFGWVRRLSGTTAASAACFLFAVNPDLIECSVEPIRESTFWFLAVSGLYFMSRAESERKLSSVGGALVAVFLSIATRSEGWLLVPFLMLVVLRSIRWTSPRHIAAVAVVLLLTFLATAHVFRHRSDEEGIRWGRWSHFYAAQRWLSQTVAAAQTSDSAAARADEGARRESDRYLTTWSRLREFSDQFLGALGMAGMAAIVTGMVLERRRLLSVRFGALLFFAAGVVGATWIQFWAWKAMDGRYFLSLLVVLAPLQAAGVLAWLRGIASLAWIPPRHQLAAFGWLLVCVSAFGSGDAFTSSHIRRSRHRRVGEWIRAELKPGRAIVVNRGAERVGFHLLDGRHPPLLIPGSTKNLFKAIEASRPDVVVVSTRKYTPRQLNFIRAFCKRFELGEHAVPDNNDDILVFVRRPGSRKLATRAADVSQSPPKKNK